MEGKIIKDQHFRIDGRSVFRRVIFHPPLEESSDLFHGACLMHIVRGRTEMYSSDHQMDLRCSDAVITKEKGYVNKWIKVGENNPYQVVMFNFHDDPTLGVPRETVLNLIGKDHREDLVKLETNNQLDSFIGSLIYYFDHPEIMTEYLIKLKVQELLLILRPGAF